MQIFNLLPRGAGQLKRVGGERSEAARRRIKWIDYYEQHGRNARLTCRHFDISPQTFYRWLRRCDRWDLSSLEDRSRRPRRRRQPTWSPELAQAVQALRTQYPRWGTRRVGDQITK